MGNESITTGEINQAAGVESSNNNVEAENTNNNVEAEESKETNTELEEAEQSKTENEESRISELERKFEEREREFEKREQELKQKELKYETLKLLQEKELSEGFCEFVMAEDMKTTKEKLGRFNNLFSEAVQKQVEKRLRGKSPTWGIETGIRANTEDIVKKAMKRG